MSKAIAAVMRALGAILALPVRLYQVTAGRVLPDRCRYTPSCSAYTVEALRVNGPFGLVQAVWRVLRCQPWGKGGEDPVRPIRPWRSFSAGQARAMSAKVNRG